MRLSKTFPLLFLTILTSQLPSGKSMAQDGGYPGAYLRIGAGVRAMGTGGAFVALANDVTAGYWNPAGLGQLTEPQLSGMYSVLSLDRQYNYVAAAYPFGAAGTIGVSWISYRVGDIEARNRYGEVTGKFGNDENALLFSYGNQLMANFALGGNVKLLFHNLAGVSAFGMGIDIGARFTPLPYLTLGAGVQNLQTQISWETAGKTRETFPVNARAGVNVKPSSIVNLTGDYEFINQQAGRWHAGCEILLGDMLGLRAGDDNGAVTLGASLMKLTVGNSVFEVDYGFVNDAIDQSASHRVSFLLKFGSSESAIAHLSKLGKKVKRAPDEKNPAASEEAKPDEEEGLTAEKTEPNELATAEPAAGAPERSTLEQILSDEQSDTTAAEPGPEKKSAGTAVTKDGLIVEKVMPDSEPDVPTAQAQPEEGSNMAEMTLDEKIARLEAQTNTGEKADAQTASGENIGTTPMTLDEKIARLEAQSNTGEKAGARTASSENIGTTPTQVVTHEKDGLTISKSTPHEEVETTTPKITYGNKNGLTIPEITPGKRIGQSLAALFQAQVIEARPVYWIINLGEREGFNTDMVVEIYQALPDNEMGRSYGVAQPHTVRSRYSIIKIIKRGAKKRPAAGERILLKYLYPAVNY